MKARSFIYLLVQVIAGAACILIAASAIGKLLNRNSDAAFYLGVLASFALAIACVFAVTKAVEKFRKIVGSKE
ncbi:MAG TPA: hypothetical protein VKA60_19450 [Blastocatellia bacterium]|nr:hypothetical protein [Blastocatellia bacterium]